MSKTKSLSLKHIFQALLHGGWPANVPLPVVFEDGAKRWYRNGKLHHTGDSPVEAYGNKYWISDGCLHREDGPAFIGVDGTKKWYRWGKLHRDDGAAIEYASGGKEWYRDGNLHRDDGPAVEYSWGAGEWYINGKSVPKAGYASEFGQPTWP